MAGGGLINTQPLEGGFLTGRKLIYPIFLITCLFFLWGFSYGLLDVLNAHFRTVLVVNRLQTTGLQVMYFGFGYLIFSPIAAEVLKRKGYKITILMGLGLYSLGAILFWPTAHFASASNSSAALGGFCVCTGVIACGLATLETAANSYAVVIGNPASAAARLQFCQSWNGVASFIGPLIASKFFFSGANQNNLDNVQFVYLAVSLAGVCVAILYVFAKLPEVQESTLEAVQGEGDQMAGQGSIWEQYNMFFGFLAQFCYVGAQVSIASLFIFYVEESGAFSVETAASTAAQMLSYALITFTVSRFLATMLATKLAPEFIMIIYALCAIALNIYICIGHGLPSVVALVIIFFFEAPMYPIIFTLGTSNLGRHTRRGAGILVMGVGGGALFPPIQAAIADAASTRISYVVPLVGFVYVFGYVTFYWARHGFQLTSRKAEAIVAQRTSVDHGKIEVLDTHVMQVEHSGELKC